MVDRGDRDEREGVEQRIARARSAIGSSFEELIARGQRGQRGEPTAGAPAPPHPSPAEGPADDQTWSGVQAAIDARLAAAEAALRSRLERALDESEMTRERRLSAEATEHRKRLDDELAAALRGARTELGRELAGQRDAVRRDLSMAAQAEIAVATTRIEELHSAAIRDAVQVAETVAASRLAAIRESLGAELRRPGEEARSEIERGIGVLERRMAELVSAIRHEQSAIDAERDGEARRRAEARVGELGAELRGRIDRELERSLALARAELAETAAAVGERSRIEVREGAEAAIAREVAKAEASLAAAAAAAKATVETSAAAALDGTEERLTAGAEDALAQAIAAARAKLEEDVGEMARAAVADQAQRTSAELQRGLTACAGEQMQAIREQTGRHSYRDHSRRAEAAATEQLARSLDALEEQRNELTGELARAGEAERQRHRAELEDAAAAIRADLEARAERLESGLEAAAAARAEEAVGAAVRRRDEASEGRIGELIAADEERVAARLAAAVSTAERRLAAVADAQAREERIRERTAAAERAATERVREAEQRLIEVLARIDGAEHRSS